MVKHVLNIDDVVRLEEDCTVKLNVLSRSPTLSSCVLIVFSRGIASALILIKCSQLCDNTAHLLA